MMDKASNLLTEAHLGPEGQGNCSCSADGLPPKVGADADHGTVPRRGQSTDEFLCQYVGHIEVGQNARVVVRSAHKHGEPCVDVRLYYFRATTRSWHPTRRGWRVPVDDMQALASILLTACDVARGKQTPLAAPEDIVV